MIEYIVLGSRKRTLYFSTSCTEKGYRRRGLSSLLRLVLFLSARSLSCVRIASDAVTDESSRMLSRMGFSTVRRRFHGYPYNRVLYTRDRVFARLLRRFLVAIESCDLPHTSNEYLSTSA